MGSRQQAERSEPAASAGGAEANPYESPCIEEATDDAIDTRSAHSRFKYWLPILITTCVFVALDVFVSAVAFDAVTAEEKFYKFLKLLPVAFIVSFILSGPMTVAMYLDSERKARSRRLRRLSDVLENH